MADCMVRCNVTKPSCNEFTRARTYYNFIILMTFTSFARAYAPSLFQQPKNHSEWNYSCSALFCYCLFCRWINDNHYYRADNHIAKASWITCAHDNICGTNQLTKKLQLLKLCAALHRISLLPSRNATKSYHYVNWAYTNTYTPRTVYSRRIEP